MNLCGLRGFSRVKKITFQVPETLNFFKNAYIFKEFKFRCKFRSSFKSGEKLMDRTLKIKEILMDSLLF